MKKSAMTGLLFLLLAFTVSCTGSDGGSETGGNEEDAKLSYLSISNGTLTPSFSPDTYTYYVNVDSDVAQVKVTPTAVSGSADIAVVGNAVASGSESPAIQLIDGHNSVNIVIDGPGGYKRTYLVDFIRTVSTTVASPTFSLPSGTTFPSSLDVTLDCTTTGAQIYYTTNGSAPTTGSSLFSDKIPITETTTIKAIAVKTGKTNSAVVEATYTKSLLEQVATPVFTPASGTTFTDSLNVTISCATAGASVYYTTNGNAPSASSTPYAGEISITATATIKAIAVKSGMSNSTVAEATYTKISNNVADPVFTPASGTKFATSLEVTITTATDGASIYYTTNNTPPTAASTPYTGKVTITDTTSFRAIAIKAGSSDSAVITSSYSKTSTDPLMPYSVNPTYGKYKSSGIAIDGAIGSGEWTNDMLICVNMAGDDPRNIASNWSLHETPFDVTHMWAAWDDSNLYIAWQYADVTDIVDPNNAGSAGGTKPYQQNTPSWLAFDTIAGGSALDMWGKNSGKPYWTGTDLPDYQMYIAGNLFQAFISKVIGTAFAGDPQGPNYYKFMQNPAQGKTVGTPVTTIITSGIQAAWVPGFAATKLYGVKDCDDRNTSSKVVEFIGLGHDITRDTFYEMKIPFTVLGITKSSLESTGIGIMLGQGEKSSIDTIPRDDAALTDTTAASPSNSPMEWGDIDSYTVPFARIGKAK